MVALAIELFLLASACGLLLGLTGYHRKRTVIKINGNEKELHENEKKFYKQRKILYGTSVWAWVITSFYIFIRYSYDPRPPSYSDMIMMSIILGLLIGFSTGITVLFGYEIGVWIYERGIYLKRKIGEMRPNGH